MDRTQSTSIDEDKCIGCGKCVPVCPADAISMKNGKAVVTGNESLACGHCEAVCPVGAVRVGRIDPTTANFETFTAAVNWIAPGDADTAELVQLMRSRRSCRNYQTRPVNRSVLEDLVKIGITAPSGSNCQRWTFTLLPDRTSMIDFGNAIAGFFHRLNRLSEKAMVRNLLKWIGKGELDWYFRNYHDSVRDALQEREATGRDRLFHGATAGIVVGSKTGASCPAEDALLATQNILLAAHTMGLGSCLVGFAVSAMKQDRKIQTRIGIPAEESVCSVIALGYPNETYQRCTGRLPVTIRTTTLS